MVRAKSITALIGQHMRGDRLRTVRERRELTRKELSQVTGISETQLTRYEHGSSDPTANQLEKIADALSVSADYLLGRADDVGDKFDEEGLSPVERKLIDALRSGRLNDALNSFTALSNKVNQ